jgi:hypothetical protein
MSFSYTKKIKLACAISCTCASTILVQMLPDRQLLTEDLTA